MSRRTEIAADRGGSFGDNPRIPAATRVDPNALIAQLDADGAVVRKAIMMPHRRRRAT